MPPTPRTPLPRSRVGSLTRTRAEARVELVSARRDSSLHLSGQKPEVRQQKPVRTGHRRLGPACCWPPASQGRGGYVLGLAWVCPPSQIAELRARLWRPITRSNWASSSVTCGWPSRPSWQVNSTRSRSTTSSFNTPGQPRNSESSGAWEHRDLGANSSRRATCSGGASSFRADGMNKASGIPRGRLGHNGHSGQPAVHEDRFGF